VISGGIRWIGSVWEYGKKRYCARRRKPRSDSNNIMANNPASRLTSRGSARDHASAPSPNQRRASPPAFTAQTANADNGKVTKGHSLAGPRGLLSCTRIRLLIIVLFAIRTVARETIETVSPGNCQPRPGARGDVARKQSR